MSMITELVDRLRKYARTIGNIGTMHKDLLEAADTIEELAGKIHAIQMERSLQYYNNGWIPCSERLPEYGIEVLVYIGDFPYLAWYDGGYWNMEDFTVYKDKITAWMPLPKLWKPQESEDKK